MGNLLIETSTAHITHEQELVYHMCMTNAHVFTWKTAAES